MQRVPRIAQGPNIPKTVVMRVGAIGEVQFCLRISAQSD
jgi:hypothetical protein